MKKEEITQEVVPSQEVIQIANVFVKEIFEKNKLGLNHASYYLEYVNMIAYFCMYGYIPIELPDDSSEKEKISVALIAISSTPWMGAVSERYSIVLEELINLNILQFKTYKMIECVLILDTQLQEYSETVRKELYTVHRKIEECYEKRTLLHKDLGWTISAQDIKQEVLRILENIDKREKITLKLVTYHGRNWFGFDKSGGFIQDMLVKYSNLRVKILIVDKNACISIRECNNSVDCVNSSNNGVISIFNMPYQYRKRIQIRYYGKKIDEGFLRGIIIQSENRTILTRITNWRFGYERPLYGRAIALHPESSLGLLCNTYFDSIFSKTKPAGRPIDILIYYLRIYALKIVYATIPAVFIWKTFKMYWENVDVLYPTLISIGFAVWGFLGPFLLGRKDNE